MMNGMDIHTDIEIDGEVMIVRPVLRCIKCGYSWVSRVDQPKECPHCKSRNWDS
jgi:predicted Zn-ribbon and HTH transcriptional regulator